MKRRSEISPLLLARMKELDLKNLQALAEQGKISGDTLRSNVSGDRAFSLHTALQVLRSLNYELDSEPLLLLIEMDNLKL